MFINSGLLLSWFAYISVETAHILQRDEKKDGSYFGLHKIVLEGEAGDTIHSI